MKNLLVLLLLALSATAVSAREIGSYANISMEKLFEIKDDLEVDQVVQNVLGTEGAMQFQMYKAIEMQVKMNLKAIEAFGFVDKDGKYDLLITIKTPEGTAGLDMYIPMAFVQEGDHYAIMDQYKEGIKAIGYKENIVLKKEGSNYILATDIALINEKTEIEQDLKKVKYYEYLKEDKNNLGTAYSNMNVGINFSFDNNPQMQEMSEIMKPYMEYMKKTFNYNASYTKYNKAEGMFYIKGESVDEKKNKSAETYIKFPIGFFKEYVKLMGNIVKTTMEKQKAMSTMGNTPNGYQPSEEEMKMLEDYNY